MSWLSVVGCFVFSRWRDHTFLSSARIFCSIKDNIWLLSISLGNPTLKSEFPASRTTFSRLPYFCAPLPPYFCPSLGCSRLQVNQEDQKPRFNFQDVPKLNILVHFLAFVLAGGSLVPDESYYRSVFLIKLSFTNRVITVWPFFFFLTSRCRDESLSSLCNVTAIGISKSNKEKTRGRRNVQSLLLLHPCLLSLFDVSN